MKIKSISYENYQGKVYNFHCSPNENYYANGVLAHNCYKENGSGPLLNMTFSMFKNIFDKISATKILTQIAFGITDIYTNPDFFKMMEYCRENGVIPNYTTSGFDLDDNAVEQTIKLCGAVAVSIHQKEVAFNAIKKLTEVILDSSIYVEEFKN